LPDLAGPPDHGALGIADPAHVEPLAARREAFATAYRQLARRIGAFVALPLETLSAQEAAAARRIHEEGEA
jgi:arsenate reductase